MMKFRYLVVILAFWIAGCSSPDEPNDHSGSVDLTILAVYGDSLFGGEQFTLKVDRPDVKAEDLRLFVYTVEMQIDSVVGLMIYATANPGEPGKIRLYHRDKEAKGDFSLYLYPQTIEDFLRPIANFWPLEGRLHDTITIWFDTVYNDIERLHPKINSVPLEYVGPRDLGQVAGHGYRIPEGVSDGPVTIEMFGHRGSIGRFDIRHDDESFYAESTLQQISFTLMIGLNAQLITEGDTSWIGSPADGFSVDTHPGKAFVTHGDSIRTDFHYSDDQLLRTIRFAMSYDTVRRTVSGWISYMYSGPSLDHPAASDSLYLAFKDLSWTKKDRIYTIECSSDAVANALVDVYYEHIDKRNGLILRADEYNLGDVAEPRLSIGLAF